MNFLAIYARNNAYMKIESQGTGETETECIKETMALPFPSSFPPPSSDYYIIMYYYHYYYYHVNYYHCLDLVP